MMLANCAKHFLDDEWMIQHMSFGCLICGQHFFSRHRFLNHLMDVHNYHQYLTEKLHHLLLMIHPAKMCTYCGSTSHTSAVGKRCIVIFNLATALCNGWYIRRDGRAEHGPSSLHLAECSQLCSTSAAWPLWRREQREQGKQGSSTEWTHGQETQGRQTQAAAGATQGLQPGLAPTHGQTDFEAGGHVEFSPDRTSVPGPHQHRHWECTPGPHQGHPDVEGRQQPFQGSSEASTCPDHGDSSEGPGAQFEPLPGQGRCGEGMLAPSHPGSEHGDAISEVEPAGSTTGAHHGQASEGGRSFEAPGRNDQVDGRQCHHSEISFNATSDGHTNPGHSMAMDGIVAQQPGAVATDQVSEFSLMLAARAMQGEVPQHATFSSSPTIEQDDLKPRLVRLLLNPSHTLCYANAALQCLAWVSILCSRVTAAVWNKGFRLIDA